MKPVRTLLIAATLLAVGLFGIPNPAHALEATFYRVVDTTTPVPGGTGNFTAFPPSPCISGDTVVFSGEGDSTEGIYAVQWPDPGPPGIVADTTTAISPDAGNFTGFYPPNPILPPGPCVNGNTVVFYGHGETVEGIYAVQYPNPGPPGIVADTTTAISPDAGNFTGFYPPDPVHVPPNPIINGNTVVFYGHGETVEGIYAVQYPDPGPPDIVADTTTFVPGTRNLIDTFAAFHGSPAFSGDAVLFVGEGASGIQGLYAVQLPNPGPPEIVADTATFVPGTDPALEETFAAFRGSPSVSGETAAFIGGGTLGTEGVYSVQYPNPGPPDIVADTTTPIPGGTGNFTGFYPMDVINHPPSPNISGDAIALVGFGDGQKGIYVSGSLHHVVAVGDMLDGKTVADVGVGETGLDNGVLAFWVSFTDGSEGIYVAELTRCIQFDGFHNPIGGADETGGTVADPLRAFKLKSTIPIKMTLTDCDDGTPVTTGTHTIAVVKWSDATDSDEPINATPTDAATTGNAFRLADPETGEWHYNLSITATGMSTGTWEIVVTLSDGNVHTAFISVK